MLKYIFYSFIIIIFIAAITWIVINNAHVTENNSLASEDIPQCLTDIGGQVWIEGQTFTMGENEAYPDEKPEHKVTVDGFWIDSHEVTNHQFSKFVEATGYVTVAERMPDTENLTDVPPEMLQAGSAVFTPPKPGEAIINWWSYIPGANWKHPQGPGSSIENKPYHPVVHIAFEDAQAYAKWVGRDLPTEAQYELASRSQKEGEIYAWGGNQLTRDNQYMANTWQGNFPVENTEKDGYTGIAPVGCYEANDYGVYDLIGNVWEWTNNWYAPYHDPKDNLNPKGPEGYTAFYSQESTFPVRVIKGGSYLCAANYCLRYRPAARHAQDTGLGTNHIGFRTVLNKVKN